MKKFVVSSCLAITIYAFCIVLSWHLLSSFNFFFSKLYEIHKIDQQIEKYAPQNRNRSGFEFTTKEEQTRIFREIVKEINYYGSGLESISYHDKDGKKIDAFLTSAEVEHLVDVSMLIQGMNRLGLALAGILLILLFFTWTYKVRHARYFWKPPNIWLLFFNMVFLIFALACCVFTIGPRLVFHKLHEWIFFNKGQWFFYFQDSLMTTLLPESIFGSISILMAIFALMFWIMICSVVNKILL